MNAPRWWALTLVCAAAVATVPAAPSAAQSAAVPDIRIEADTRARTEPSQLGAFFIVTLVEPGTDRPVDQPHLVFGMAQNAAGEQTTTFDCARAVYNDPEASPGDYLCSVYADHGGSWEFVAIVSRVSDGTRPPVEIGRRSAPFELTTTKVYTGGGGTAVRADGLAVAMLLAHVLLTTVWFTAAGLIAMLGVPVLRRRLSPQGIYGLERRLDLIARAQWWLTALVIGSGIYLLANETAYKTPTSVSGFDGVFALPYGKPYFVALLLKLGFYALLIPGLVPLIRRAQAERHRPAADTVTPPPVGRGARQPEVDGALATMVEAPPQPAPTTRRSTDRLANVAAASLTAGLAGIAVCVTFLKYFHQLIEAAR